MIHTTVVPTLLAVIRSHLLITFHSHAAVMLAMRLLLPEMNVYAKILTSAVPEYTLVALMHHALTAKELMTALVMTASVVMVLCVMMSMSVTAKQTVALTQRVATLSVAMNVTAQLVT